MNLRKANKSDITILLQTYKNKKTEDLKNIKIKWAVGLYKEKMSLSCQSYLDGYLFFYVKTDQLIYKANFGEMRYVPLQPEILFNGVNERDWRIAKILDYCNDNLYLDPPIISVDKYGKLSFDDGRHRTIVAFNLGKKKIPVAIHLDHVKEIEKIIDLQPVI